MGISTSAAVFVGLPRDELGTNRDADELGLSTCPPYYDGGIDALVGFTYRLTGESCAEEFVWDQAEVDKLRAQFKEITGLTAKVWLSPFVI